MNAVAQRADTVRPVRAEEWSRAARLAYVVMPRYDEARLVRLLRLLRAPPLEWIRRAQRIPLEMGLRRERVAEATTLTDRDLTELGRRLERDPSFRQQFDVDPVAATEAAGMPELGSRLQREISELIALAERVASDDAYRAELVADPLTALGAAGVPAGSAEPLLQMLAVSPEVLAKLPEVEAHLLGERSRNERLLLLLLTSTAVADELRAAARRA